MELEKEIILYYSIISITLLMFIFFGYYWKSDMYKKLKFRTFFTLLSALAVLFSILAIIIQTFNYIETTNVNDTQSYNDLAEIFYNGTFKMFLDSPDMNYYFYDLLDEKHIDTYSPNRNLVKEYQMSMLIFGRCVPLIFYININKNKLNGVKKGVIIGRFNHVLHTFFKSKTFREYWEKYDRNLAGDPIRIYFKREFNIKSKYWFDPTLEPEYNPSFTYKD